MKKHSIVLIFVLALILLLCGCGRGKVGERQLKEDLNNRFLEQQFIVDDVKIDLAKHEKNTSLYNITVNMTTPNANVERMYRVLYNYYDVGGWIMEDVIEINTEDWKAEPIKFDVSNEKIADIIFSKSNSGGFYLKVGGNQYFDKWTVGFSDEKSPESFIDNVFYEEKDIKSGNLQLTVSCSARSNAWEIREMFLLEWEYNIKVLEWEYICGESIKHEQKISESIEGTYTTNNALEYSSLIKVKENKMFITGYYGGIGSAQNMEMIIDGLFYGHFSGGRSQSWSYYPDLNEISIWDGVWGYKLKK